MLQTEVSAESLPPLSPSDRALLEQYQRGLEQKRKDTFERRNPAVPVSKQGPATPSVRTDPRELLGAAWAKMGPRPTRPAIPNPELPPCPLCRATAFDGPYVYATDLSHDCTCADSRRGAYDAALTRLWDREHALERYLAQVPKKFKNSTLESIVQTPDNRAALKAVSEMTPASFLYLHGGSGTGKSELACAIGRRDALSGLTVRYWPVVDLCEALRASQGDRLAFPTPELKHWDTLILDDLEKYHAPKESRFIFAALYAVLEYRWLEGKKTIFTSNHDVFATGLYIAQSDPKDAEAITSRLGSGAVKPMGGKDYRYGQGARG